MDSLKACRDKPDIQVDFEKASQTLESMKAVLNQILERQKAQYLSNSQQLGVNVQGLQVKSDIEKIEKNIREIQDL